MKISAEVFSLLKQGGLEQGRNSKCPLWNWVRTFSLYQQEVQPNYSESSTGRTGQEHPYMQTKLGLVACYSKNECTPGEVHPVSEKVSKEECSYQLWPYVQWFWWTEKQGLWGVEDRERWGAEVGLGILFVASTLFQEWFLGYFATSAWFLHSRLYWPSHVLVETVSVLQEHHTLILQEGWILIFKAR